MKRNLARQQNRNNKRKPGAPAREPGPARLPELNLRDRRKLAFLNVRGIIRGRKTDEIENYMDTYTIDIMTLQETHSGEATREKRKKTHMVSFRW